MGVANVHLLGQIAVKEGFVTPEQLEECVRLQAEAGGKALGTILVEKGYLTPVKLTEITRLQRVRFEALGADPARGGLFGQLALRHGYVTAPQLAEALREQEALARGGSALQLGQILIRKEYLSSAHFLEILRLQKKEVAKCPGCETFYDVSAAHGSATFTCSSCGTVVRAPGSSRQTG